MLSTADLRASHQKMCEHVGRLLHCRVLLSPPAKRENLNRLHSGGTCSFELAPADGRQERAFSRGRQIVFPLAPLSHNVADYEVGHLWVGWFEVWRCRDKGTFDLQAAAWTLYWGFIGDERKAQVLRAEWDQSYRLDAEPSNAGHPHWHVDAELPLREAAVPRARRALEPISEIQESRLTIERLHLAMAGWLNHARRNPLAPQPEGEVPACWQHDFHGSADQLTTWSVRTLRYLQTQSTFLRIK
jgi:hypothetical protein